MLGRGTLKNSVVVLAAVVLAVVVVFAVVFVFVVVAAVVLVVVVADGVESRRSSTLNDGLK